LSDWLNPDSFRATILRIAYTAPDGVFFSESVVGETPKSAERCISGHKRLLFDMICANGSRFLFTLDTFHDYFTWTDSLISWIALAFALGINTTVVFSFDFDLHGIKLLLDN
jgi:hypothetical protein